jgi:hypothetical protein
MVTWYQLEMRIELLDAVLIFWPLVCFYSGASVMGVGGIAVGGVRCAASQTILVVKKHKLTAHD